MVQAVRTGLNAKASGDTGRVMVVLLTDGRANVSLAKSNEDPEALAEGAPKPSKVRSASHAMPRCAMLCHAMPCHAMLVVLCLLSGTYQTPTHMH